jgi:threonine synthase
VALVNSVNPYRIEGQKTAAFEVCEAMGRTPATLALPVGNAGNVTAYWKGFKEWPSEDTLPRTLGFQAEGAAPLVEGRDVEAPETVASAIRIGAPANRDAALAAVSEAGGLIDSVTDEEILAAQETLGQEEGVFCEPASAAGVAGILKLAREGGSLDGPVVCVLTGHGLKDQAVILERNQLPEPIPASFEAVAERIEWAIA